MNALTKIILQIALCGVSFAAAAFLCAAVVLAGAGGEDWRILILTAPVSAATIAVLCWLFFTWGGSRVKIWKGIVTGVLAGSVSHFFAWYLALICLYLWGAVASDSSPTVGFIDGLGASFIMTFFSLAILGWITVPFGAIVGAACAWISSRWLK